MMKSSTNDRWDLERKSPNTLELLENVLLLIVRINYRENFDELSGAWGYTLPAKICILHGSMNALLSKGFVTTVDIYI